MRIQSFGSLSAIALLGAGCGGGAPLLHPAHVLPVDTVTAGAGVSGNFVLGDAGDAIDGATAVNSQQGAAILPEQQEEFFRGGFAYTLVTPGLAPWVGARVGLGLDNEAGATYTARSIRVDARHALQDESWAASVGLGGTGHLMRPGSDPPVAPGGEATVSASGSIPGLDEGSITGWGLDLPVLVGWRSTPALVQLWAGVRGGFEQLWGEYVWQFSSGFLEEAKMEGKRWHAGGLLGLQVGVDALWAALEIDFAYHRGDATLDWQTGEGATDFSAGVQAVTITPAGALGARF